MFLRTILFLIINFSPLFRNDFSGEGGTSKWYSSLTRALEPPGLGI